ncbi:deoxyguanosinetriphosphate triphosphohydrolase [Amorphus orientalis]|uniref:Deoxyguanosinetriphosphate triphosphohydrolase-like protein n=1 Tax=Amorphus orientalis TaxID=649198 RepID=A0AAE3VPW5_9HYPH|nr:deoxyguanosinetriphosphate triphosphohydrolase [Amorphus orientalis]MDQ0315576.1 dGTPase [Amorphus orientalis]
MSEDRAFDRPRAAYAADPDRSRGRRLPEPGSPTRSDFQRDRDRIVHSTAFRRLTHKTQVFVSLEGDHYRTRLTHSLEVAQIARSISRVLGLDEDLAESVALAHDFGHTPFGHEGEDVLDRCMADFGGFDHNAQSYRILTRLERRYAGFNGLNLTWETLEGLVKHNGPLADASGNGIGRYAGRVLPHAFRSDPDFLGLEPWTQPSLEAQVAAIADDIAYDAHDIDDGLRAGLIEIEDLRGVPLVGDFLREIEERYPGLERPRVVHEIGRRVLTRMIEDVIGETRRRIEADGVDSIDAVRACPRMLAAFSEPMEEAERAVKAFLMERVYRAPSVMAVRDRVGGIVADLFDVFLRRPETMPDQWRQDLDPADESQLPRRVCDYIAGMTDRFAFQEHRRLFDATPDLR